MIIDNKKNLNSYKGISANLDYVLDYLQEGNFTNLIKGVNILKPDEVICIYNTFPLRVSAGLDFESHQKNLDLHYCIEGEENLIISTNNQIEIVQSYDEKDDYLLSKYDANIKDVTLTKLKAGDMAILFPQDLHIPLLVNDASVLPKNIEKMIFKIKI